MAPLTLKPRQQIARRGDVHPDVMDGWRSTVWTYTPRQVVKPVYVPAAAPAENKWATGIARNAEVAAIEAARKNELLAARKAITQARGVKPCLMKVLATNPAEAALYQERIEKIKGDQLALKLKQVVKGPLVANGDFRKKKSPKQVKTSSYHDEVKKVLTTPKVEKTPFVGQQREQPKEEGKISSCSDFGVFYYKETDIKNVFSQEGVVIAHCTSRDWSNPKRSSQGVAATLTGSGGFDKPTRKSQIGSSRLAYQNFSGKHIYTLLTKEKYNQKPVEKDFLESLELLVKDLYEKGLKSVVIPPIGMGRDSLSQRFVGFCIVETLLKNGITVLMCHDGRIKLRSLLDSIQFNLGVAKKGWKKVQPKKASSVKRPLKDSTLKNAVTNSFFVLEGSSDKPSTKEGNESPVVSTTSKNKKPKKAVKRKVACKVYKKLNIKQLPTDKLEDLVKQEKMVVNSLLQGKNKVAEKTAAKNWLKEVTKEIASRQPKTESAKASTIWDCQKQAEKAVRTARRDGLKDFISRNVERLSHVNALLDAYKRHKTELALLEDDVKSFKRTVAGHQQTPEQRKIIGQFLSLANNKRAMLLKDMSNLTKRARSITGLFAVPTVTAPKQTAIKQEPVRQVNTNKPVDAPLCDRRLVRRNRFSVLIEDPCPYSKDHSHDVAEPDVTPVVKRKHRKTKAPHAMRSYRLENLAYTKNLQNKTRGKYIISSFNTRPQHSDPSSKDPIIALDILSEEPSHFARITNDLWVIEGGKAFHVLLNKEPTTFATPGSIKGHVISRLRTFTSQKNFTSGAPIVNAFGEKCSIITISSRSKYAVSTPLRPMHHVNCKSRSCRFCDMSRYNVYHNTEDFFPITTWPGDKDSSLANILMGLQQRGYPVHNSDSFYRLFSEGKLILDCSTILELSNSYNLPTMNTISVCSQEKIGNILSYVTGDSFTTPVGLGICLMSTIKVEKIIKDLIVVVRRNFPHNIDVLDFRGFRAYNKIQVALLSAATLLIDSYAATNSLPTTHLLFYTLLFKGLINKYLDSRGVIYDECNPDQMVITLPYLTNIMRQIGGNEFNGLYKIENLITLNRDNPRTSIRKNLTKRFFDYFRFHSFKSRTPVYHGEHKNALFFSALEASSGSSSASYCISFSDTSSHEHRYMVTRESTFLENLVKIFEFMDDGQEKILEICDKNWTSLGYLDSSGLRAEHIGIIFVDTYRVDEDLVGSVIGDLYSPKGFTLELDCEALCHAYDKVAQVKAYFCFRNEQMFVISTDVLISGSPVAVQNHKVGIITYSLLYDHNNIYYYVYPLAYIPTKIFTPTRVKINKTYKAWPVDLMIDEFNQKKTLVEVPTVTSYQIKRAEGFDSSYMRSVNAYIEAAIRAEHSELLASTCHGQCVADHNFEEMLSNYNDQLKATSENSLQLANRHDIGPHVICPDKSNCPMCCYFNTLLSSKSKDLSLSGSQRGAGITEILQKKMVLPLTSRFSACFGQDNSDSFRRIKPSSSRYDRLENCLQQMKKQSPGDIVSNYLSTLTERFEEWKCAMREHWEVDYLRFPSLNEDGYNCVPHIYYRTLWSFSNKVEAGVNILIQESDVKTNTDKYLVINVSKTDKKHTLDWVYDELRNAVVFLFSQGWPGIGIIDELNTLDIKKLVNDCTIQDWYFGVTTIHLCSNNNKYRKHMEKLLQQTPYTTCLIPNEIRRNGPMFTSCGVFNVSTEESISQWLSVGEASWSEANVNVPDDARNCAKKLIDNPEDVPIFMEPGKFATYTIRSALSTGSGFSDGCSFATSHHVTRGNNILMWANKAKGSFTTHPQTEYTLQAVTKNASGDYDMYTMPVEFTRPKLGHIYAAINSTFDFCTWFMCNKVGMSVESRKSCKFDIFVPVDIDWKAGTVKVAKWRRNPGLSGSPLIGANNDIVGIYGLNRTSEQEQVQDKKFISPAITIKTNIALSPVPPSTMDIVSYFKAAALEYINYSIADKNTQYSHLIAATGTGKSTLLPVEILKLLAANKKRGTKICLLQPMVSAVDGCYSRIQHNLGKMGSSWKNDFKLTKIIGKFGRNEKDSYVSEGQGSIELVISTYGRFMHDLKVSDTTMHNYKYVLMDEIHTAATDDDVASVDVLKHHKTTTECKYLLLTATSIGGVSPYALLNGKELTACRHEITEDYFEDTEHYIPGSEDKWFWINLGAAHVNCKTKPFVKIPIEYTQVGRVLIFVPSRNDCEKLCSQARKDYPLMSANIYSLHAGSKRGLIDELSENAIIFCTDYASVSITIRNCRCVVDFQLDYKPVKSCCLTPNGFIYNHQLVKSYVTKQVAKQRKGRTGRTCPGIYLSPKSAQLAEATLDLPETYPSVFFNMMLKVSNPQTISRRLNHTPRTEAICGSDWLLPENLDDHFSTCWAGVIGGTTEVSKFLLSYTGFFTNRLKIVKRWDKDQLWCYLAPFVSRNWVDATCDADKKLMHGTSHTDPNVALNIERYWYIMNEQSEVANMEHLLSYTCYSFREDLSDMRIISETAAQLGVQQTTQELMKSYSRMKGVERNIEVPDDTETLDNAYLGMTVAVSGLAFLLSSGLTLWEREAWRRVSACHYIDRHNLSAGVKAVHETSCVITEITEGQQSWCSKVFKSFKKLIVRFWHKIKSVFRGIKNFFSPKEKTGSEHQDADLLTVTALLEAAESWFLTTGFSMPLAGFTGVWSAMTGFTYNNLCSKIGPMLTWTLTCLIQCGISYITVTGGIATGIITIVTYLINVLTCQNKSLIGRPNFTGRTGVLMVGMAGATWLGSTLSSVILSAPALHYQHMTVPAALQSVVNPQISGVSSTASGVIIVKMIYNIMRGSKITSTNSYAQIGTLFYYLATTNPISSMTAIAVGTTLAIFRGFLKDAQWWRNCMLTLNVKNEKALRLLNLDEEGMKQGDASFDLLIENGLAIAGILANPLSIVSVVLNIIADCITYHMRGLPSEDWTVGGVMHENFVHCSGIPAVFGVALAMSKVASEMCTKASDDIETEDSLPVLVGTGILANVVAFVYYMRKVLSDFWYEDNCRDFFQQVPIALKNIWESFKRVLNWIAAQIGKVGRAIGNAACDTVDYVASKTWRKFKSRYTSETVTLVTGIVGVKYLSPDDAKIEFDLLRRTKAKWRNMIKAITAKSFDEPSTSLGIELKLMTRSTPCAAIANLIVSHENYGDREYGIVPSFMLQKFTFGDPEGHLTTSYSKPTVGYTLLRSIKGYVPYAFMCMKPDVLCYALSAIGECEVYEATGSVLFDLRIDSSGTNIDLRLMMHNEFTNLSGVLTIELISYDVLTKTPSSRWGHVEYFYTRMSDNSLSGCMIGHGAAGNLWPSILSKVLNNISIFKQMVVEEFEDVDKGPHQFFRSWVSGCNAEKSDLLSFMSTYECLRFSKPTWWKKITDGAKNAAYVAADMTVVGSALSGFNRKFNIVANPIKAASLLDIISYKSFYESEIAYMRNESLEPCSDYFCLPDKVISSWTTISQCEMKEYLKDTPDSTYFEYKQLKLDVVLTKPSNVSCLNPVFYHPLSEVKLRFDGSNKDNLRHILEYAGYYGGFGVILVYQTDDYCVEPELNLTTGLCGCQLLYCVNIKAKKVGFHIINCEREDCSSNLDKLTHGHDLFPEPDVTLTKFKWDHCGLMLWEKTTLSDSYAKAVSYISAKIGTVQQFLENDDSIDTKVEFASLHQIKPVNNNNSQARNKENDETSVLSDTSEYQDAFSFVPWFTGSDETTELEGLNLMVNTGHTNATITQLPTIRQKTKRLDKIWKFISIEQGYIETKIETAHKACYSLKYQDVLREKYSLYTVDELYDLSLDGSQQVKKEVSDYLTITHTSTTMSRNPWLTGFDKCQIKKSTLDRWLTDGNTDIYKPSKVDTSALLEKITAYNSYVSKLKKADWEENRYTNRMALPWQQPQSGEGQIYASRAALKAQLLYENEPGFFNDCKSFFEPCCGFGGFAQFFSHQFATMEPRNYYVSTLTHKTAATPNWSIINADRSNCKVVRVLEHVADGNICNPKILKEIKSMMKDNPMDCVLLDIGETFNDPEKELNWWTATRKFSPSEDAARSSILYGVTSILENLPRNGKAVVKFNTYNRQTTQIIHAITKNFRKIRGHKLATTPQAGREFYLFCQGYDKEWESPYKRASVFTNCYAEELQSAVTIGENIYKSKGRGYPSPLNHSWFTPAASGSYYRTLPKNNYGIGGGNFGTSSVDFGNLPAGHAMDFTVKNKTGEWKIKNSWNPDWHNRMRLFKQYVHNINHEAGLNRQSLGKQDSPQGRKVFFSDEIKSDFKNVTPVGSFRCKQPKTRLKNTHNMLISGYLAQVVGMNVNNCTYGHTQATPEYVKPSLLRRLDVDPGQPRPKNVYDFAKCVDLLLTDPGRKLLGNSRFLSKEEVLSAMNNQGSTGILDPGHNMTDFCETFPNWYEYIIEKIFTRYANGESTHMYFSVRTKPEPKERKDVDNGRLQHNPQTVTLEELEKNRNLSPRFIQFADCLSRLSHYIVFGHLLSTHGKTKLYKGSINGTPPHIQGRIIRSYYDMHMKPSQRIVHLGNNPNVDMFVKPSSTSNMTHEHGLNSAMLSTETSHGHEETLPSALTIDFSALDSTVTTSERMIMCENWKRFFSSDFEKKVVDGVCREMNYAICLNDEGDIWVRAGQRGSGELLTSIENTYLVAANIACSISQALGITLEELLQTEGTLRVLTNGRQFNQLGCDYNVYNCIDSYKLDHKKFEFTKVPFLIDGDDVLIITNRRRNKILLNYFNSKENWLTQNCKAIRSGNKAGATMHLKFEDFSFCSHTYEPVFVGDKALDHVPEYGQTIDHMGRESNKILQLAQDKNFKIFFLPKRPTANILSKLMVTLKTKALKWNPDDVRPGGCVDLTQSKIISYLLLYPQIRWVRYAGLSLLTVAGDHLASFEAFKKRYPDFEIESSQKIKNFSKFISALISLYGVDTLNNISIRQYRTDSNEIAVLNHNSKLTGHRSARTKSFFLKQSFEWIHSHQKYDVLPLTWDCTVWKKYLEYNDDPTLLGFSSKTRSFVAFSFSNNNKFSSIFSWIHSLF